MSWYPQSRSEEVTLRPISTIIGEWTPVGQPENHLCVDEPGDSDSDFVSVGNGQANDQDIYGLDDLPPHLDEVRLDVYLMSRFTIKFPGQVPRVRIRYGGADGVYANGPTIILTADDTIYTVAVFTPTFPRPYRIGVQDVGGQGGKRVSKMWAVARYTVWNPPRRPRRAR